MNDIINKNNYHHYSLNQINCITNNKLRNEILILYYNDLKEIIKDKKTEIVSFIKDNESLENIYNNIEEFYDSLKSNIIFNGDYVRFYPNIRIFKSQIEITCHFSGSIIRKNQEYCNYYPLLYNISKKKSYKLNKRIKCEIGYFYNLPTTLHDFELFYNNLENSYNLINDDLNYYDISSNLGDYKILQIKRS